MQVRAGLGVDRDLVAAGGADVTGGGEPAAPAVLVRIEAKDPICGMMVDSVTARFRSEFAERTVYFCCRHCKEMFDEDPERYRAALS